MTSHSSIFAAMTLVSYASASNLTSRYGPTYVSGPDGRGTVGLLTSCIVTFVVCTWTAVHPDIIPQKNLRALILHKLGLMLKATLLPEGIVLVAFLQWRQARHILATWKKRYGKETKCLWIPDIIHRVARSILHSEFSVLHGPTRLLTTCWGRFEEESRPGSQGSGSSLSSKELGLNNSKDSHSRCECLGMSGAFFVVMGGLVIEHEATITTVTPKGFEKLVEEGVFDSLFDCGSLNKNNFHQNVFQDKGNADTLAKSLVCLQILWMTGQCIGRQIQGLPLTLLEYHVMLHVCYTITTYLFWLHKPLDVIVPLALPISTLPADAASSSQPNLTLQSAGKSEVVSMAIIEHFHGPGAHHKHRDIGPGYGLLFDFLTEDPNSDPGFAGLILRAWCDCSMTFGRSILRIPPGITIRRLLRLLFVITIVSMNGALHAWAWNYDFPTAAEKELYRVSCMLSIFVTVITCGLYFDNGLEWHMVNMFYQRRFESSGGKSRVKKQKGGIWSVVRAGVYDDEHHNGLARLLSRPLKWVFFSFVPVLLFLYYVAMGFVTVEAVLSVRALPKGSYKTVEWAEMLPHL